MKTTAAVLLVLAFALAVSATRNDCGCGEACDNQWNFCGNGLSCTGGHCTGWGCPGGGGDPELVGLDGRKFFFDGLKDTIFNFITEQSHQVNALFVEGPHLMAVHGKEGEHNGTYIGALGFKLYDRKIQVDVSEEGEMTVQVDGKPVELTQSNDFQQKLDSDKVKVQVNRYKQGLGQTVEIATNLYKLVVYATPRQWDDVAQNITRGHLNMGMSVDPSTYFLSNIHGVLGQVKPNTAADNALLPEELQTAFLGEGVDTDYVVSDLFADDFKYNLFYKGSSLGISGTVPEIRKTKTAASRRRLDEQVSGFPTDYQSVISGVSTA